MQGKELTRSVAHESSQVSYKIWHDSYIRSYMILAKILTRCTKNLAQVLQDSGQNIVSFSGMILI